MKRSQLERMKVEDLRVLREQVDEAIAVRERQEREDLKKKLADIVFKSGFSMTDLVGRERRRRSAIKYRNPRDPTQTWTGRGRRPTWLVKAGGDIEKYRVA